MKQIVMGILFLLFLNGCTASKISNVKFNTTKSQQSYLLEDGRTKLDVIFELEGNQVIIKKVAPSISKRTLNQYDNRNTACMTISYNKSNNTRYLNPCDISKNNKMFFKKKMRKTKGWITYPHALFAIAINTLLVPLEVISGEHPYSSFVVYDTHDISSIIELGVKLDDMLVDYSSRVNIPIEPPYISKSKTSFWGNVFKVWAYASIAATTINTLTDNGIVKAIAEEQAIRAGEKEKYKSAPSNCKEMEKTCKSNCQSITGSSGFYMGLPLPNKEQCKLKCKDAYNECDRGDTKDMNINICQSQCFSFDPGKFTDLTRSDRSKCFDSCEYR